MGSHSGNGIKRNCRRNLNLIDDYFNSVQIFKNIQYTVSISLLRAPSKNNFKTDR